MATCIQRTQGGKGNKGMFVERDPKVCAAGKPTVQATEYIADQLKYYLLQDEVDAIIHDAIIPTSKEKTLSSPKLLDTRNAGIFTEVRDLINPPPQTKFKALVEEFKNTTYRSYWKKQVGWVSDQVPMLPEGFNITTKTMGKKTESSGPLYDLIMPRDCVLGDSRPSKHPGYQTDRNYCRPAYDLNNIFGMKTNPDKRGIYAKCCMTDDTQILGTCRSTPITAAQADFKETNEARLGISKSPNNNINFVPRGFSFGLLKPPDNLPECLIICEQNTGREFFLKCLVHLNTLRKCLSKRCNSLFFGQFYLHLKYLDKAKTGWLPRQDVYNFCAVKHIRFDPSLIEPLLEMWNAFDGSQIKYKMFVHIINYREPSPTLSKIPDISEECIEFSTTYNDMVKPGQEVDKKLRAGLPSGRYCDRDYPVIPFGYCKADTAFLPQESDAKSCLNPSVLTILGVTHRDMYAKRSPEEIKRVFEAAGDSFSDENFNKIWDEAKKYHSQEWVCNETFKRALNKINDESVI